MDSHDTVDFHATPWMCARSPPRAQVLVPTEGSVFVPPHLRVLHVTSEVRSTLGATAHRRQGAIETKSRDD